MLYLSRLPCGLVLALAAALQATAAPSVNVGMNAAFPRAPYLLELLETAASENATAYFPLLDKIASGHFATAGSDADLYTKFLEILQEDGHITSPDALSTFKLALSLRSAAPRIEAHYQYYSTAVEQAVGAKADADECKDWIQFDHKQYCSAHLDTAANTKTLAVKDKSLPFDRVLGAGKVAVLYADPVSPSFGKFHSALTELARKGDISYRLRYRRSSQAPEAPISVSGYGIELTLKRTDYIVIDDREGSKDAAQAPINAEVVLDGEEDVADLKPLSTSELAPLGLKAASFILKSENPFEALVKSTQDFPKFSTSIAGHEVSEEFVKEMESNRQNMVPSGINFLWMNGVQLIERQIEPFTLVEMIRRERKLIDGVRELGFNGKQAVSLLGHRLVSEAKSEDAAIRFDWTDRSEDGKVILWLNDLEKDEQYQGLPTELRALLQRTYPGQLPQIARNIFHVVAPVDFSNDEDVAVAIQLVGFMQRGLPLRFGLAPLASTPDAVGQAKIAYHLIQNYGIQAFVAYVQATYKKESNLSPDENAFTTITSEHTLLPDATEMTLAEILKAEVYAEQIKLSDQWTSRLNANSAVRPIFANGVAIPREANWMQALSAKVSEDLQVVQRSVYMGTIGDDDWVPQVFLEKAMKKRNAYIFPEADKDLQILDINKVYDEYKDLFNQIPVLEASSDSTKENWAVLTTVVDVDNQHGQELLLSALQFKRNNPGVRLDIIHNPSANSPSGTNGILKANQDKIAEVETLEDLKAILKAPGGSEVPSYETALISFLSATNIVPGSQALILNGRVIGPFPSSAAFKEDDFQQFLEFEQTNRILPVYAAIDDLGLSDKISGPIAAAKLTSVTALSTISDLPEGIFESAPAIRSTLYTTWNSTNSAIEVGDPEKASIHIAGLLNPVSEQGQRWAPILKVLSELDGVYLKLFMNPLEKTEELPIKRFFRYVLDSEPSFDEAGNIKGPKATFKGLPSEALLTAGMDVPPAWLVAAKASVYDLDNIKLSSVTGDVDVTYELENILIEGHSRDSQTRSPPRGAQLVLATEKNPLLTDTIIMANLGYFQFKANPGFYNIQLKDGRSADIYTIESIGAQGYASASGDQGTDIALMDFQGTTLYPRLRRKPGKEDLDVLESANSTTDGLIAKGLKFAESILGGSKPKAVSVEAHADINIFSVASGHLYERMLNIMMVSVMRNTKHTVKFWFIEQFLSPSFKEFIPHLAAEYGFKYEMVTYKWPHWLRQQKEKQREIWGYKILFLDVLFPLSLDKVIFVDADQIVRTDMMDLVNHDLEGAPYGFTPMCDSRTEMEGFRFWKQGYWANYLRGLPYHISALYVVDLRRFRQLAAGDRLRQQYHALSADPNSLANLDQDLPNHMQFQIPIHSLPQEWLWCETWCSDESLSSARTIDLCNNPQTKEPKLDRARRQVPEWTEYDDEIAAVDRRRKEEEKSEEGRGEAKNTKSRALEDEGKGKDEL